MSSSVNSDAADPEAVQALARALQSLGCPPDKTLAMAQQLDKRARQLAGQTGRPYHDALQHLLALMSQGWAAKNQ